MKLTERDWLEQVKLAGKIYSETYTHNTVTINNFIINSRFIYTIFSRVYESPMDFHRVINKHVWFGNQVGH